MSQKVREETKTIDKFFRDIHKYLVEYTKEHLKELDLTMPRFLVLWHITKNEPINMSSLHQKMYMANSTLTVIIDKLLEENLVKRYRNPEDRRMVLIELTDKGSKKLREVLKVRQKFLEKALSDLDYKKQQQLTCLLKPISNNLKNLLTQ
ncbi:MAG: MarR family winged helix-turn-helix transcriptional regulator [Bacillota bacterium]